MWNSAETTTREAKEAAFAVRQQILARDPQETTKSPNAHNITLP